MLHNSPKLKRSLMIVKDNLVNICSITALVILFFFPWIALFITLFIIYLVYAQFRKIPFYRSLRWLGFDCFYLAYSLDKELGTYVGNQLLEHRDDYRHDYISLGFELFHTHASEIIELDAKFKKLLSDNETIENCFF